MRVSPTYGIYKFTLQFRRRDLVRHDEQYGFFRPQTNVELAEQERLSSALLVCTHITQPMRKSHATGPREPSRSFPLVCCSPIEPV